MLDLLFHSTRCHLKTGPSKLSKFMKSKIIYKIEFYSLKIAHSSHYITFLKKAQKKEDFHLESSRNK